MVSSNKVICVFAPGGVEDLISVIDRIEGRFIKAEIDPCFPLESAAEAHRNAEGRSKNGYSALSVDLDLNLKPINLMTSSVRELRQ